MQRILTSAFLVMILAAAIPKGLWRGENGYIRFESDAPLELITAESKSLKGIIDPQKNTFAFSIPASSFKGFNSALQQEHFHENYFESSKYPRSSFSGKFIENVTDLPSGVHEVRTKGILNIHGVPVERIIKCTLEVNDMAVIVSSNFSVPLSDHKISIPQVVHQKIAEEIFVEVKITMHRL